MNNLLNKLMNKLNKEVPTGATHYRIINRRCPVFYRNVFEGTHDKMSISEFEWYTIRTNAPHDIIKL